MPCTGTAELSTTMGISWRSSGSACSGGSLGSAAAAADWLAELLPFLSIRAAVARDRHPCPLMAIWACPSFGQPCSGSVIREVVIRRAPERGLVRYQPFLVPEVD
jgi:hypothetical protein